MSDDYTTAVAASAQEGRQVMGTTVADQISHLRVASSFAHPELVRQKMNTQSGDPAFCGHGCASARNPVAAERLGARFAPSVSVRGPVLPEAAATQANGRIVPPRIIRSVDSFGQGISTSMA